MVDMSKEEHSDVKAYYDALTQHIKTLRKERKISQLKLATFLVTTPHRLLPVFSFVKIKPTTILPI
jgi:DNA-binding transcriptional regulator YiaG